ncbi:MAG: glycosyltransferase family 4 protein [Glaciimonas sp.]|nr:glycosyltransferase family 4 protein [Glaciimonas sp.]
MKRYIKSAIRKVAQQLLGDAFVRSQSTWVGYTRDAMQLANIIDCTPEQMQRQQQHPERIAASVKDRICNWYLPQFDNPFYGGIMTILRLAEYLQRCHGIKQRILICGSANAAEVSANISLAFPLLSQAEVIVLDTTHAIINIPPSDYSVATLWTTAYVLLGVQNTGYKFYMIQDFEPAFYPAGSTYAQAELSYRFGFYGIANTQSLKEIYERDYGGSAVVLKPTIDKTVFYPSTGKKASSPKRLFYYARPGTPRNGFELAAAALQRLKEKYGDAIDIVCAGAGWNPAEYGLTGVVRSIGMLPYAATGDLYRSCHAGFVMMMTKHPSYLPFELMACGAIVVTNFNQANTWLLKDGQNCLLSAPSATCLAATLSYALDHYDDLAPLRQRAANDIFDNAGDWDSSLGEVAKFVFDQPIAAHHTQPIGSLFVATTQP